MANSRNRTGKADRAWDRSRGKSDGGGYPLLSRFVYTADGEAIPERTIGGTNGPEVGQFAFVTDVVHDARGNYFISEYGEFDRIQKYDPSGNFICRFGSTEMAPSNSVDPSA